MVRMVKTKNKLSHFQCRNSLIVQKYNDLLKLQKSEYDLNFLTSQSTLHSLFFLGGEDQAPAAKYSKSEAKLEIGKTAGEEKTRNPNKAKQSNQSTASQKKIESGDTVENIALHPNSDLNFGGESKGGGQEESVQCSTRHQEAGVQIGNTLQNKNPSAREELLKSGVDVEKTKRNCEEVKLKKKKKKNWIDKPKCSVNNESINSSECTGIFENESASEKSENTVFSETSDAKPEKDKSALENVSLHKEADTAKASADISTEEGQAQKGGITVECEQSENTVSPKIEIEAQCESGHGQVGKTVASRKDGEKKQTGDLVGAAGGRQGGREGEGQGGGLGGGQGGEQGGEQGGGQGGEQGGGQGGLTLCQFYVLVHLPQIMMMVFLPQISFNNPLSVSAASVLGKYQQIQLISVFSGISFKCLSNKTGFIILSNLE